MHRHPWHRLDWSAPSRWSWAAFTSPRHRFDSATGQFRVRYAASSARVAMRERFDAQGRVVPATDLRLHLVQLTGTVRVLDLRLDRNLDALGLDDQVSTSRAPDQWAAGQELADLALGWFGERCDGIVYRSRTSPQRAANMAFFRHAPLQARSLGRLGQQDGLLAACVLSDGFTVEGW